MSLLKNILILCLLALSYLSYGQYSISGTIKEMAGNTIMLRRYTGLRLINVDSTTIDGQDSFHFDIQLSQGMYEITSPNGFNMELLYEDKPIQFVCQDYNNPATLQFIGSDINNDWHEYTLLRDETLYLLEVLKPILRGYDPASEFYLNSKKEYHSLQETFLRKVDSIIASKNNYATRLIKADRPVPIDLNTDASTQTAFLKEHLFDGVDFNDMSLIPTNVLTTKMIDYLSLYNCATQNQEMNLIMGLADILERAKTNIKMYAFVLEYMLEGFNALGMDKVCEYLLSLPQLYEGEISMETWKELDSITLPFQKIKVGVVAPNISGLTLNDSYFSLSDSDAEHYILLFWSTECDHCQRILDELGPFLESHPSILLITDAIASSEKEVQKILRKKKSIGHHFYDDLRWEGDNYKNYHVFATPTIFILNKDKVIVSKPLDFEELKQYFSQLSQQ